MICDHTMHRAMMIPTNPHATLQMIPRNTPDSTGGINGKAGTTGRTNHGGAPGRTGMGGSKPIQLSNGNTPIPIRPPERKKES